MIKRHKYHDYLLNIIWSNDCFLLNKDDLSYGKEAIQTDIYNGYQVPFFSAQNALGMLQLAHGQQLLAIPALTKIYRGRWILVASTISTASQSCLKNMMVTVGFKIFLFKIKSNDK